MSDCVPVPVAILRALSREYGQELAPLIEQIAAHLYDEGLDSDARDLERATRDCDRPVAMIQELINAHDRLQAKKTGAA